MTTTRSLAWLHCASCQDTTLHDYNRCRKCQAPNNSSGNPPVPKPYPRFNTIRAKNFDPVLEQRGEARRRARRARHQVVTGGRL